MHPGNCETCGQPMANHPSCDACGIMVGPGHIDGSVSVFRGQHICGGCNLTWQVLERLVGHPVKAEDKWVERRRLWARMSKVNPFIVSAMKDKELLEMEYDG